MTKLWHNFHEVVPSSSLPYMVSNKSEKMPSLKKPLSNQKIKRQRRLHTTQIILAKPPDAWRGKHFAATRKNDMRLAKRIRPIGFKDGAKIGIILEPCSTRRHFRGIFSVFLFRGLYVAHFVHRKICF